MSSPVPDGSISAILAEFRQQPELSPLAAELLWQAVGALRSAVRRAADTDLADLIAGASGGGQGVAIPAIPHDDGGGARQTLADATAHFQVQHIRRTIEQSEGNMSRAADRLGLNRSNLYRKMRQLGMAFPEGGSGDGGDGGSGISL
jgi:Nif-specific regulatory protein